MKMIQEPDFKLKYVGGASFVQNTPVFSKDGQFIIVAVYNILYSYTTKTGKRFLQFKGLEENIINYGVYTCDGTEFVAACTMSGNIMCWKLSNGLKIKQTSLNNIQDVKHFQIIQTTPGTYKAVIVSLIDNNQFTSQTNILQMDNFNLHKCNATWKCGKNTKFAVGGQDDNLFLASAHYMKQSINVMQLSENGKSKHRTDRKITEIHAHPTEEVIMTGDISGRVVIWYNIFDKPVQCVYHWHTLGVNALCFFSSGTGFFTGGEECVLIKWTTEDVANRKFLPRLSGRIRKIGIAPENLYLAVATSDNAIHIVDMQFNYVSIIQELVFGEEFPAGLHLDPKTQALVMNGTYGHLQFYAPKKMQLLYNLDVVGMNRITDERNAEMENTNVKTIAISKNGLWMATFEERIDHGEFPESRLKFFSYNLTNQSFQLNTNIEYAHEGSVVEMQFQPSNNEENHRLVTIGIDGFFKVWQLVDVTSVYKKGYSWRCASAGFYRSLIPKALAFSFDGSLLAVAFDSILTAWVPNTIELKCSLLHPIYQESLTHVAFGTSSQCHLIVTASKRRLSVWNTLTLAMIWTVPLKVMHLISDLFTTHMAVITMTNKLFVFEPNSELPLAEHILFDEANQHKTVLAATFVPNPYNQGKHGSWQDTTQLFIINSDKELHVVDGSGAYDDPIEPMHFMLNERTDSTFSFMTPAMKSKAVEYPTHVRHTLMQRGKRSKLDDLLEGSIHTMVPMRMIAYDIISSLIYEKPVDPPRKELEDTQMIDKQPITNKTSNEFTQIEEITEDLAKVALEPTTWTSIMT